MRQEEGSSDEEADMLMALADQAGPTPKSHSQRSSQQVATVYFCSDQCHQCCPNEGLNRLLMMLMLDTD